MKRFLFLLALFPATAFGQAHDYVTLLTSAAITSNTNGSMVCLNDDQWYNVTDFILNQEADVNSGTLPTIDTTIQYTLDGGTTWFDLYSFTQITGGTVGQAAHVDSSTTSLVRCMRAKVVLGGTTPNVDTVVKVFFKPFRK